MSVRPSSFVLRPSSRPPGLRVAAVQPHGLAAHGGLRPGDRVLTVNGQPVRDVIDYQFHTAEDEVAVEVEREGGLERLTITASGEGLGLEFEQPTSDGIRTCKNKCPFCFLKGLPRGLRRSLYLKDDDYRYSFLFGNFITLSNLSEADWRRLEEQRLSPLYVSVHGTEPAIHRLMLGNEAAPDVMEQLRRLGQAGLQVHSQVVLCPGLNDGEHLARTVEDLASLYPVVQSIAVVPVGLTPRHGEIDRRTGSSALRCFTLAEAAEVWRQVQPWQRRFRAALARTLVYLSDEFYLLAGRPFPRATRYDGYPQYENGVGMARVLLDEWASVRRRLAVGRLALPGSVRRTAVVCGRLPAPLLAPAIDGLNQRLGSALELLVVENRLFGPTVTVSGCLAGGDVLAALRDRGGFEQVVLPRSMLDTPGRRFLDELTPADLERELGTRVRVAGTLRDLLGVLSEEEEARPAA